MFGAPIPRPWQLLGLKTVAYLMPWYIVQVVDALVVGGAAELRHRRSLSRDGTDSRNAKRATDMADFLSRRRGR